MLRLKLPFEISRSATEIMCSYNQISRLIRLTSPNLIYIIGAGAVLLYLDMCLTVVPTTDPDVVKVLCNVS